MTEFKKYDRVLKDRLITSIKNLAAGQKQLGSEFEDVWDQNADMLHKPSIKRETDF